VQEATGRVGCHGPSVYTAAKPPYAPLVPQNLRYFLCQQWAGNHGLCITVPGLVHRFFVVGFFCFFAW